MIYKAITAIMSEMDAIGKDHTNKQQGNFKYRGIDDVMNALHPLLIKHKVFLVPEILEQTREERTTKAGGNLIYSICKIKYTFYAEDGSKIESIVIGEGMDSGDKATNKAMAVAFKYVCFQVFCIPTGDDPDAESHEVKGKVYEEEPDAQEFIEDFIYVCKDCGEEITATSKRTKVEVLEGARKYYKRQVCGPCMSRLYKEKQNG